MLLVALTYGDMHRTAPQFCERTQTTLGAVLGLLGIPDPDGLVVPVCFHNSYGRR